MKRFQTRRKLLIALGVVAILALSSTFAIPAAGTPPAQTKRTRDMKISLSTDLSSPAHWDRVIDFAMHHGVSRVVYWGDLKDFYVYPKHPGLLPEETRGEVNEERGRFQSTARKAKRAGLEFWYVFQVSNLPDIKHVKSVLPSLFNEAGEPDMSGTLAYQLIRDQLDEIHTLVPELDGIETWVMEGAAVQVAHLAHQKLPLEEICARIVETVHDHIKPWGLEMAVDLHTSGGDPVTRAALLKAAERHRDIIVSGDNVEGDFNPHLPFNRFLLKAAQTNPVQVHFDLNGEYWGRNFVPTSALNLYAEHLEIAREHHFRYVDGRVSTAHDFWSPHANVLPSRRRFYPGLESISDNKPLPGDLNITSTDTLGEFNAEFFCRRAKDPSVQPVDVVREFLRREFGEKATVLTSTFLKLEGTLRKIFFTDKNYFGFQSVLPNARAVALNALPLHLACSKGTEFPPADFLRANAAKPGYKFAFAGWPTPQGHRCAGPVAMIREKQEALEFAEAMLREVRAGGRELTPQDRRFLVRQFEDLVLLARAYRSLLEAMVHYDMITLKRKDDGLPDPERFQAVLKEMDRVASEWEKRYAGGRYLLAERLREWLRAMGHS